MDTKVKCESARALESFLQSDLIHPKLIAMNLFSLVGIGFFSGTFATAFVLFAYVLVNFGLTELIRAARDEVVRGRIHAAVLAGNILVFIILQQKGFIGILDSNNANAPSTAACLMGYAFYVLQTLTIQCAVYRRQIVRLDFQRYLLAVSFCGAFLAGPLFNYEQLKKIEELDLVVPTPTRISRYLHFFIGALLFKYVFANWLSQWVSLHELRSPMIISRSVLCFELQVYFDFAGYSLLSYFLCRIFDIPMYHNFQHPFAARNIPEFWRRWHTGLGTFFKENVFIPLKSVYPSLTSTRVLLPIAVFLLSAAWHGPTRNFLIWGLFHGTAFAVSVLLLKRFPNGFWVRILARLSLFVVLFYGRLLFMESNYEDLMQKLTRLGMFKRLFHELAFSIPSFASMAAAFLSNWDSFLVGAGIVVFLSYEIFLVDSRSTRTYQIFKPGIWSLILLVIVLLFFQPAEHGGFVYGR